MIKSILPFWLKRAIRSISNSAERFVVRVFCLHPILSSVYYLFFSRSFDREHYAVLKGRVEYYKSLSGKGVNNALLRRNIHRLEKGLIMRPRREVFAEAFIAETIDCYEQFVSNRNWCNEERKWVEDVLTEYFSIVGDSKIISKARREFALIRQYDDKSESKEALSEAVVDSYKPYSHKTLPLSPVSFEQLEILFKRRRSVRWYKNQEVPYELIMKAVNIATYAPSACNRQPYKFLIVTDKSKAVEISKCAGGTGGFADNLQAIIVVLGDLSAYPYEKDRHLIYIDGSLAVMQLMLALESLNISSCPINWPDIEMSERKLEKLLDLLPQERVIMLMAAGYADDEGGVAFSQKKKNNFIAERFK